MSEEPNVEWRRYGEAVIGSMSDVLPEVHDTHHPVLLETADYWLSLGLTIGLQQPDQAARLLALIEPDESSRGELREDSAAFVSEVLE